MIARPAPANFTDVRGLIALLGEVKTLPVDDADSIRCLAALDLRQRIRVLESPALPLPPRSARQVGWAFCGRQRIRPIP